jgi:hypothetical protein
MIILTCGIATVALGISLAKDIITQRIRDNILKEGTTDNKESMLKAFDSYVNKYYKKYTKTPGIWITADSTNTPGYCNSLMIEITKENSKVIRDALLTQELDKVFKDSNNIDFEKLKTINGKYCPYFNTFHVDYCTDNQG